MWKAPQSPSDDPDLLHAAMQYANQYYVYWPKSLLEELCEAQRLLVQLVFSLLRAYKSRCLDLLSAGARLDQLRSSYLAFWLRDDFNFPEEDVAKAVSFLGSLVREQGASPPHSVVSALAGLPTKYPLEEYYRRRKDTSGRMMLSIMITTYDRYVQTAHKEPVSCAVQTDNSYHKMKSKYVQTSVNERDATSKGVQVGPIVKDRGIAANLTVADASLLEVDSTNQFSTSNPAPPTNPFKDSASTVPSASLSSASTVPSASLSSASTVPSASHSSACTAPSSVSSTSIYSEEDPQAMLMQAVGNDDPAAVKMAVMKGAQMDLVNVWQDCALHQAARGGKARAAKALIELGASVDNVAGRCRYSPLIAAAAEGQAALVRMLLEAGAKVNFKDSDKETALHAAVRNGSTTCVRELLNHGVNPKPGVFSTTLNPLVIAAHMGNISIIKLLLPYSLGREIGVLKALLMAAKGGHLDCLKILIEAGADVNYKCLYTGKRAIHFAAENGDLEMVKVLLRNGAKHSNKDDYNKTPLQYAEAKGHSPIVQLLENVN